MSRDPYTRLPRATLWLLRGDTFTMGGHGPDNGPRFEVAARAIYIGKTPITNEHYEAYDPGHARSSRSPNDGDPVVDVSFRDAVGYCQWYSKQSGKDFRLPTEVEWEFACRSGTETRYYWGDDPGVAGEYAWDEECSGGHCHPVESLKSNPFGLYDMLGNVWEWTSSLHLPYPIANDDDRDDLERAGNRVIRGGSFRTPRADYGCAVRSSLDPDERRDDVGFRIVRYL